MLAFQFRSHSPRIGPIVKDACIYLFLFALTSLALQSTGLAKTIYVDSKSNREDADGTLNKPFSNLNEALIHLSEGEANIIQLEAGIYRNETQSEIFSTIPKTEFPLTIRGSSIGETVLDLSDSNSVGLSLTATNSTKHSLTIEGIHFNGGSRAIVGITTGQVNIRNCRFSHQRYSSVELVTEQVRSLNVDLEKLDFDASSLKAIDFGTRPHSTLNINLSQIQIVRGPTSPSPRSASTLMIQSGVSIYLADSAQINGKIENSRIQDCGNGIQLTGAESGRAGTLNLTLVSNQIIGNKSPEKNYLHTSLQCSRLLRHMGKIELYLNTLIGSQESVIQIHNEEFQSPDEIECGNLSIEAVGNIFSSQSERELSWELNSEARSDSLPCFQARKNAFEKSQRAGFGDNYKLIPTDWHWSESRGYLPIKFGGLTDKLSLDDFPQSLELTSARDPFDHCRLSDAKGDGEYLLDYGAIEASGPCFGETPLFIRGDCSQNQVVELTDSVVLLHYIFLGEQKPACLDACDFNDDGRNNLGDALGLLLYLFHGNAQPKSPFPELGFDPTVDGLAACK